jgi:hypothetical protein
VLSHPRQRFDLILDLFRHILAGSRGEIPRAGNFSDRIRQNDAAEVVPVIIENPMHLQLVLNFESGLRVSQNL